MNAGNRDYENLLSSNIDMGDAVVFDAVFIRFYAALCQFACKYLDDSADAEDVVSQVFGRAWGVQTSFDSLDHARSYFYKATYHAALNHRRNEQRASQHQNQYATETDWVDETYFPNLIKSEFISAIYQAIDRLPAHYANVLRLSFADDLTNEEIVQRLQLNMQTVKNYKSKGLALLRKELSTQTHLLVIVSILFS